jgi:DNA polymerase III delta prime subunit
MSTIKSYIEVSPKEAIKIVVGMYESSIKQNTNMPNFLFTGPKGIGKTEISKEIAQIIKMRCLVIDAPNFDISDGGIPMPNGDGTVSFLPNKDYNLHIDEPQLIVIDEGLKAGNMASAAFNPLLAQGEKYFGGIKVHSKCVIILTGNMPEEGLGDVLHDHTNNRIVALHIKSPTTEEWVEDFAIANSAHPLVMAYATRTPQIFQSYKDLAEGESNTRIWNKKIKNKGVSVCTPRSMFEASGIMYAYTDGHISLRMLEATLEGCIGVTASREMVTFLKHYKEIPTPEAIRENWRTAVQPSNASGQMLVAMAALTWVQDADDLDKFIQYITQPNFMSTEGVAVFMTQAAKPKKDLNAPLFKATTRSAHFQKWVVDNRHLFSNQ